MMTDAEFSAWEEGHKKNMHKKKRERRFLEAEQKIKAQQEEVIPMPLNSLSLKNCTPSKQNNGSTPTKAQ